jgi:hypothetical protein
MPLEEAGEATRALADQYLASIRAEAGRRLTERQLDIIRFEDRLYARWREPLDLFDLILVLFQEATEIFDKENSSKAMETQNFTFQALLRLAIRACKTAGEIHCLLRGGHSDGAYARWRTLHEVAATAMFISAAGPETAERYCNWEVIESWKSARTYQAHAAVNGYEPLDSENLKSLEFARDRLLNRYRKEYESDYGWALEGARKLDPSLAKTGKIGFDAIERLSGMHHRRPDYKLACIPIHAGPKTGRYSLGVINRGSDICVGPSNFGLAEAGSQACLSLLQIIATLCLLNADLEIYVRLVAVETLTAEAQRSFASVQTQIEQEEADRSNGTS